MANRHGVVVFALIGCGSAVRTPPTNRGVERPLATPPWLAATKLGPPGPVAADTPTVLTRVPNPGRFQRIAVQPTENEEYTCRLAFEDVAGWRQTEWTEPCRSEGSGEMTVEGVRAIGGILAVDLSLTTREAYDTTKQALVLCGEGPSHAPSCTRPIIVGYVLERVAGAENEPHPKLEHQWSVRADVEADQLVVRDEHGAREGVEGVAAVPGRWAIGFP